MPAAPAIVSHGNPSSRSALARYPAYLPPAFVSLQPGRGHEAQHRCQQHVQHEHTHRARGLGCVFPEEKLRPDIGLQQVVEYEFLREDAYVPKPIKHPPDQDTAVGHVAHGASIYQSAYLAGRLTKVSRGWLRG